MVLTINKQTKIVYFKKHHMTININNIYKKVLLQDASRGVKGLSRDRKSHPLNVYMMKKDE